MIPLLDFNNQTVAVLGLGRSGLSAASALLAGGARVLAWDDRLEAREYANKSGVSTTALEEVDWEQIQVLVMSPGIPLTFPAPHRVVRLARQGGCEILSDVELLWRSQQEATFFGITGTNGKSTTTVLLGHILSSIGIKSAVGGNLGTPVLDLEPLGSKGSYVLELSSYQLDLCPTAAMDVAILLNITPDHLDRHGGMAGYVAAKRRIFENQRQDGIAIVGLDDEVSRDIHRGLAHQSGRQIIGVSGARKIDGGVYALDGILIDGLGDSAREVLDLRSLQALPGGHNHQNAAAAYAAAKIAGYDTEKIAEAVRSFPGLIHRQERLGSIGGVGFVNDSKATNPDATAKALGSYRGIYWIAGGREKDGGYEVLDPHLENVRHAFLVGEAADTIQAWLSERVPNHLSKTIDTATRAAFEQAVRDRYPDAVVVLSPACASFDQFPDFEKRGEFFKACVAALAAEKGDTLSFPSIQAGGFA